MEEKNRAETLRSLSFGLMILTGLSAVGAHICDRIDRGNGEFEFIYKVSLAACCIWALAWLVFRGISQVYDGPEYPRWGNDDDDWGNGGGGGPDDDPPPDPTPPPGPEHGKDLAEEVIRDVRAKAKDKAPEKPKEPALR